MLASRSAYATPYTEISSAKKKPVNYQQKEIKILRKRERESETIRNATEERVGT